ncbi:MAG TPA: oligosaccharide flippase family protein [Solirubrobacteraceae bacterium]|jgi:O-antigen/teichoic acid export membrane protein
MKRGSYGAGLGHGAFSFLANAVLALLTSVVVARLYGVQVIGEYALAAAPAGAVWLLSTVREQPALMRRLTPLPPRDPLVTGLFAAVLTFSSALTAGVSLLVGLLTWWLFKGPIDHPGLIAPAEAMLVASLLFVNTCWNLDTVLSAFRAGRPLLLSRMHQALVYLALSIALSFPMPSVWGLIVAWYASWATSMVQRLASCRAFMRLRVGRGALREGFSILPELLRFGLRLTPGFLAEGISDEAGTWILGALVALPTIGAYNRAWTIARRGLELNYRITEMLFPTLVERRLLQDSEGFDRALVDSLRYTAIAMLLPAAVAAGAAVPIMSIYGPGFAAGAGAFAFLVFVPGIVTLSAVQSQALFAEGRGMLASSYGLARAFVTLFAAVLLVNAHGVSGVGAGMLIGACAQLAPLSAGLPRLLGSDLSQLVRAREAISLVGAGIVGFAIARLLSAALSDPLALLLAPTLGLCAAAAVFIVIGGVQPRDRERVQLLIGVFGARLSLAAGRPRGSSGRT